MKLMRDSIKRNNVRIAGSGSQPLLFAHGFGLDQTSWASLIPAFQDDYKIVTFDYVGTGDTDLSYYNDARYATLEGYAQDVKELCEDLGLTDTIFVGHSVSAMIGVAAALKGPSYFSKMIFIAPSPRYLNDDRYTGGFNQGQLDSIVKSIDRNYEAWVREQVPVILNNPDRPEIEKKLISTFLKVDERVARQFAATLFFADYRKALLKFNIPTLIVQCQNDVMCPIQVGDYLHAHLYNSTLRMLDTQGHFPHLINPEEVISVMKQYLNND